MKATFSLLLLIVALTFEVSNCKCIKQVELVCNKASKCDDGCQRRRYLATFANSPLGVPVQPLLKNRVPIVIPNYEQEQYTNRKSSKRLCPHYECFIKSCQNKCQKVIAESPVSFKVIRFNKGSAEDNNLSIDFDELYNSEPQYQFDEIDDFIPSFDECNECSQRPQPHWDEIIDLIPSFYECNECSQRPQRHNDEMIELIPSFDECNECSQRPQPHCDEIIDSIASDYDESFQQPQYHCDEIIDSNPSFDDCVQIC